MFGGARDDGDAENWTVDLGRARGVMDAYLDSAAEQKQHMDGVWGHQ